MTMQLSFNFDISKAFRLFVLAALLVGSLQVTQCGGSSDDVAAAARDQHHRMNP